MLDRRKVITIVIFKLIGTIILEPFRNKRTWSSMHTLSWKSEGTPGVVEKLLQECAKPHNINFLSKFSLHIQINALRLENFDGYVLTTIGSSVAESVTTRLSKDSKFKPQ